MKPFLIPVFPGTNCDKETFYWVDRNLEGNVAFWDAKSPQKFHPQDVGAVVVPGGFSHGDYLRAGALAARSPVMQTIKEWAKAGVPILGICNGFQILCEANVLPGVLLPNGSKQHIHSWVPLSHPLEAASNPQSCLWLPSQNPQLVWKAFEQIHGPLALPISCGMGRYHPARAESQEGFKVKLRYQDNLPQSFEAIAGISNESGNVLGLMPHPERASHPTVGSVQGLLLLWSLAQNQNLKIKQGSLLQQFHLQLNEVMSRLGTKETL